ncbi:MAG: hypothetical protein HYZ27_08615 [Deltaproteobacteria bacterium]|nr:hypothetical protein [Deltaproteobacteria bacterium]
MSALAHEVREEIAYDLVRDHFDALLLLIERPLTVAEATAKLGTPQALARMVRHGLVSVEGDAVRASARVYEELRNEDMLGWLDHFVLPALVPSVEGQGFAGLHTRYLRLDEAQIRGMRASHIDPFLAELVAASDLPASGPLYRLTTLVSGTSHVLADELEEGEQALRHVQQASLQRAEPQQRGRAVLVQYHMLADGRRYAAALQAVDKLNQSLAPLVERTPSDASYHLLVATHWRCPNPDGRNPTKQ